MQCFRKKYNSTHCINILIYNNKIIAIISLNISTISVILAVKANYTIKDFSYIVVAYFQDFDFIFNGIFSIWTFLVRNTSRRTKGVVAPGGRGSQI